MVQHRGNLGTGGGRIAFIIGLDFVLAENVEILSRDERGRLQEKNVFFY
jgi:hypothetical protein